MNDQERTKEEKKKKKSAESGRGKEGEPGDDPREKEIASEDGFPKKQPKVDG